MSRNELVDELKGWATPISVIAMGIGMFVSMNTKIALDNDAVKNLSKRIEEIEQRFALKMEKTDIKTEQLLVNTSVIQAQLNDLKIKK